MSTLFNTRLLTSALDPVDTEQFKTVESPDFRKIFSIELPLENPAKIYNN